MDTIGATDRRRFIDEADLSPLVDRDNDRNVDVLVRTWLCLLLDSPLGAPPLRVIKAQVRRFNLGLVVEIARLRSLADRLNRTGQATDEGTIVESLHRDKDLKRSPIFREYSAWYENGDPLLYKWMLSVLWFGKKAQIFNPELKTRAFRSWCEVENELEHHETPVHMLKDLRAILAYNLPPIDHSKFQVAFGPGSVSEKKIKKFSDKLHVAYHPDIEHLFDYVLPPGSPIRELIIPDELFWSKSSTVHRLRSRRYSRVAFAPKDGKSVRTFCMEPNTFMFGQQCIRPSIEACISDKRCGFAGAIHLRDQSYNQIAALHASEDQQQVTIDLSSASDRLSARLLEFVLPFDILELYVLTRTQLTEMPNGHIVEVNKAAPMGSALCFPLQCIVFAGICTLARRLSRVGRDFDEYRDSGVPAGGRCRADASLRVYGDDIIVDADIAPTVMSLLTAFGFRVNTDKSFTGNSTFRESCGMFAREGSDVSPILFKIKGLRRRDPRSIPALVDLANRLFKAGYFTARDRVLAEIPGNCRIFTCPGSAYQAFSGAHVLGYEPNSSGFTPHYTRKYGYHPKSYLGRKLYRRANDDVQRLEFRVRVLRSHVTPLASTDAERFAYAKWLSAAAQASPHTVTSRLGVPTPGLVAKWPGLIKQWIQDARAVGKSPSAGNVSEPRLVGVWTPV